MCGCLVCYCVGRWGLNYGRCRFVLRLVIQSHNFLHETITRRRRATTPRNITLRFPISIPYTRADRITIVIVRLHFATILQSPGRILRRIMDDPYFERTAALDGASLALAFVVCELAGVFHPACSCADVKAESAGGAVFGKSAAAFCGPGFAVGA